MRDSARKRRVTKPPLRERGRGTAKRWWGRKGIAACGMGAPIGSLRSPLTDLSEKQAHRAQLNGKQVVWENVPRTRVKRSVIGRR